jgi:hypothetical protein
MRLNDTAFAIDLDFLVHELRVRVADGRTESFPLEDGLSVAAFDAQSARRARLARPRRRDPRGAVRRADDDPVPERTPSTRRTTGEYVERFWRVLDFSAARLDEFAGRFHGKQSPTHVFWHSLDLAQTRFSGRSVTLPPDADSVTQEAYSAEVISFGFWAGDERIPEPSYYSYTAPEPADLTEQPLGPTPRPGHPGRPARSPCSRTTPFRTAADPKRRCSSSSRARTKPAPNAAGWDRAELET